MGSERAESPVLARARAGRADRLRSRARPVRRRAARRRAARHARHAARLASGVTLETLALASRLVSRELDHHDPVPGRYTLEVTSPGVERALRTPAHFQREIGKAVAIRLSDVGHDDRRSPACSSPPTTRRPPCGVDGPGGAGRADGPVLPDRSGQHRLRVGLGPPGEGAAPKRSQPARSARRKENS